MRRRTECRPILDYGKRVSWPPVFVDDFNGYDDTLENSIVSCPTTTTTTTTTTTRSDISLFRSTDTFLLTHVHMERLTGLDETWNKGVIICSEISAKLLYQKYRLGGDRIVRANREDW